MVTMYDTLIYHLRSTGRFERLMDLYERNYMLVRLLAPDLRSLSEGCFVSEVDSVPSLELRDITHSKYTSTFKLTYHFNETEPGARPYEPDLFIRLYHDARTCEVMSGLLPEERLVERRTRDLDEGQQLNQFLNKWLGYCLRQGHSFCGQPVSPTEVDAYCTQY